MGPTWGASVWSNQNQSTNRAPQEYFCSSGRHRERSRSAGRSRMIQKPKRDLSNRYFSIRRCHGGMWSPRGRSRRRRHGGPLEIRCCPCSWPRFLRPFGFVRRGTGAISYLTIGMQANRAEAARVIGRSAPSPSDTRGKHRISAEVKRLEQESRSLEVNSLSLAPSLPLSLPIFGLQFPSGKEIYRRKLKGQNFYPFLGVLDNCRGLLFHFPLKGSFLEVGLGDSGCYPVVLCERTWKIWSWHLIYFSRSLL